MVARDESNTTWSYCHSRSKKARAWRSPATALPDELENLGQGALPVDRAEQPIAGRVDGENEIGKRVGPVDQDGDATSGTLSRMHTVHGRRIGTYSRQPSPANAIGWPAPARSSR